MADTSDIPAADATSSAILTRLIALIGRVVAPTTLIVAILLYFGWVRTRNLYLTLGIHYSILELASQDYVLNSVTVAIDFLKWMLIVLLAIVWAHFCISWILHWKKRWRVGIVILFAIAGVILLFISYRVRGLDGVTRNMIWTSGVGLSGYALWFLSSLPSKHGSNETIASRAGQLWPSLRSLNRFLIVGLVIIGLFVTVAWYADAEGQRSAESIIACPKQRPAVTIYSQNPLTIEAPGVTTSSVSDDPEAYRYRYTGLRLLIRSNQKYFLLPEVVSSTEPQTIVLPDDSTVRIELSPGTSCRDS